MDENYICVHNGYKAIGFYELDDKNLKIILFPKKTSSWFTWKKNVVFLENYFNTLMAPKNSLPGMIKKIYFIVKPIGQKKLNA